MHPWRTARGSGLQLKVGRSDGDQTLDGRGEPMKTRLKTVKRILGIAKTRWSGDT